MSRDQETRQCVRIRGNFDMIYRSALIRAQLTAMLAKTQHHRQKFGFLISDGNHRRWSWRWRCYKDSGGFKKEGTPYIYRGDLRRGLYEPTRWLKNRQVREVRPFVGSVLDELETVHAVKLFRIMTNKLNGNVSGGIKGVWFSVLTAFPICSQLCFLTECDDFS
ncbi:hypothetical protein Tco_0906152 [Tanacetum coccineum]